MKITDLTAIEILDSRGKPTLRTFITLDDGSIHTASVPSGASTGTHEALELRDGDAKRYGGMGVLRARDHVRREIRDAITGQDVRDIRKIDDIMRLLDNTQDKSHLGANAILGVSMAATRAAAHAEKKTLYGFINEHFGNGAPLAFPRFMVNVVNGGKHANWNFDIQEFIIIPKSTSPARSAQIASEIYAALGADIKVRGLSTLIGDEGGYSPAFASNSEAYEAIISAASRIGYHNGQDYELGMDAAASEFYENGSYVLKKDGKTISPDELIAFYLDLHKKFGVISYEDPFHEDDWKSFALFKERSASLSLQIVGDDLTVTNPARIKQGIDMSAANAVIIKPNQIGSISETIDAIHEARRGGWNIAVSHRSGETEDPFIADLAYGMGADFIKTGSMARSERLAKYNRLMEIEYEIA